MPPIAHPADAAALSSILHCAGKALSLCRELRLGIHKQHHPAPSVDIFAPFARGRTDSLLSHA